MTRIASDTGGGGGGGASSKSEKALHSLSGRSHGGGSNLGSSRASPFSLLNSSSNRYVRGNVLGMCGSGCWSCRIVP